MRQSLIALAVAGALAAAAGPAVAAKPGYYSGKTDGG